MSYAYDAESTAEKWSKKLEKVLNDCRDRDKECNPRNGEFWNCKPCLNKDDQQQCIRLTGVRNLLKGMTGDQIGNICKLYKLVFSDSVCTFSNSLDHIEGRSFKPPWGVLGLGYSLRDCSFTSNNYSNHHALGKLAERLVEKGMLAAAGEEDHQNDSSAGQQPYPVDTGGE